jgi:hypothetical protein
VLLASLFIVTIVAGCSGSGLKRETMEPSATPPPAQAGPARRAGGERVSYELNLSPFGLHVVTGDLSDPAAIGARWTRHLVLWRQIEPRKGEFRDPAQVVPRLNEISDAGFEVLPRIVSVNAWAHPDRINRLNAEAARKREPMGDWTYIGTPTDLDAYRRFVTRLVEAFDGDGVRDAPGLKKGVKYWQVENEWDWRWKDSPKEFVDFLKVAYESVKAADPGATVVLGGISKLAPDAFHAGLLGDSFVLNGKTITPETLRKQKHFSEEHPLRTYVLEHGHPYFDAISFHQYGRYQTIEKEMEYLRGIMRKHDYEKPVWMTEAGGPFAPYGEEYTEDRHAQEVVKYYVTALANGVEVVFWSTYQPTPEWGAAFTNTALLDGSKRKKPAYYSYQLMTSKLGDPVRVERLFSAERGLLARFTRKEGRPLYVAWWDAGPGGRARAPENFRSLLEEKTAGKTFEITRYDGEVRKVTDLGGEIEDLIGKGPVFVEVR